MSTRMVGEDMSDERAQVSPVDGHASGIAVQMGPSETCCGAYISIVSKSRYEHDLLDWMTIRRLCGGHRLVC